MTDLPSSEISDPASDDGSSGYGQQPGPENVSILKYYLKILRRRVWIVLAVFTIVSTVGVVTAVRKPLVYRAAARIVVERQAPRVMRYESVQRDYLGWDPGFYTTQTELIRSHDVLERALQVPSVAKLFEASTASAPPRRSFISQIRATLVAILQVPPSAPAEPWERLRGQIRAEHVDETSFIEISSMSTDPRRLPVLVNSVAEAFAAYHRELKVSELGEAFQYLQVERTKEEHELEKSETALQTFRESIQDLSLNVDNDAQPAMRRLAALNEQLTEVQLKRNELFSQISVMARILEESTYFNMRPVGDGDDDSRKPLLSFPSIDGSVALESLQTKLNSARERLALLTDTYGPEHPLRVAAQGSVDVVSKQFQAALNQTLRNYQNQHEMLSIENDELQRRYDVAHSNAVSLQAESFKLMKLESDVERHRKLLDEITGRMMEIDVSAGFEKTNVAISEKARVPRRPLGPAKSRQIMVFVVLGLCVGIGLAFLAEHFDDTVHVPEDILWPLGIPLLGFVPRIHVTREQAEKHMVARRFRGLISVSGPDSSAAESYRHIRTALSFSTLKKGNKMISFVSCRPGEGKTTTITNMAVALALAGKRVLLVDADCHRPMVHHTFGLSNAAGLTDLLKGTLEMEDAIGHCMQGKAPLEGLDIIPAGVVKSNPSELLASSALKDFLDQVRGSYDWVLVDTPPILFVSDAIAISALCDATVLVVKSGRTTRSMITSSVDRISGVGIPLLGAILNDIRSSSLGRTYSSYYQHGYSRYYKNYKRSYDRPVSSGDDA